MSKRLFTALTTAIVLAFVPSALAKDTELTIDTGAALSAGFRAASPTERARAFAGIVVPGRPDAYDLMNKSIVSRVGGVIFLETASPAARLGKVCPALSYDAAAPFGSRVKVASPNGPASVELADWEVKPSVLFVDSGDHGLVSKMKEYDPIEFFGRRVEVHPAVRDTLVGFDLLLIDSIYTGDPIAAAALLDQYELKGFNREMSGNPIRDYDKSIAKQVWARLRALAKRSDFTQVMFTDWKVRFQFDQIDGKLSITGDPYYLAVGGTNTDDAVALPDTFKELGSTVLLTSDPVLFRSAFRFARTSAFFRYIKSSCPNQWKEFATAIKSNSQVDTIKVPTPVAVR